MKHPSRPGLAVLASGIAIAGLLVGLVGFHLREGSFVTVEREPPPSREPIRIGRYRFTLDGLSAEPSITYVNGTPGDPRPGDVIWLNGAQMTLGSQEECRFVAEAEGRISIETGAGLRVVWEQDLSAALEGGDDLRGRWGIHLSSSEEAESEALRRIDPEKTFVELYRWRKDDRKLPEIPSGIQYLQVAISSAEDADLDWLKRCRDLRYLRLRVRTGFDARLISNCAMLRYLDLSGVTLLNPEALSGLKALRFLDLSWAQGIEDPGFLKGLEALEELEIDGTKVTDLKALSSLQNLRRLDLARSAANDLAPLLGLGKLASVSAQQTVLKGLPAGRFASLRFLDVLSTGLAESEVEAFVSRHPDCEVRHRWAAALKAALSGADRLRVSDWGNAREAGTLFRVNSPAEVRRFIDGVRIDDDQSGESCMCAGDRPFVEFYREGKLILTLGFHHRRKLGWERESGWPGHALLEESSADFLAKWLEKHGVKAPRDDE